MPYLLPLVAGYRGRADSGFVSFRRQCPNTGRRATLFPNKRKHQTRVAHLEGFEPPDTQFRRLVVEGVAVCSLLFVNGRVWPESARVSAKTTTATEPEYRRATKKDAKRMHT